MFIRLKRMSFGDILPIFFISCCIIFASSANGNELKDEAKKTSGIELIKRDAERGNPEAQCMLGVIYYNGRMVAKDLTASFSWMEKSALQDYTPAMTYLGEMYRLGEGVKKDLEKAKFWLEKAAVNGDREAKLELETLK